MWRSENAAEQECCSVLSETLCESAEGELGGVRALPSESAAERALQGGTRYTPAGIIQLTA